MPVISKSSNFRRFLSYYKPYKGLFTANMFAAVMTAALSLALPLCVRHITGNILTSGVSDVLPDILRTGALMIAIITAQTCSGAFNDWMGHVMGARIERGLRAELFAHYQKLPFSFYDNKNTGELMSRLTNDLHAMSEVYHHVPIMALTYSVQFTGSIVILLHINWRLAVLIFIILLAIALYAVVFYKRLQIAYKTNLERIAGVNAAAQENLSGIRVVKSFANEDTELKKFAAENNRFYESRANIYKNESLFYSLVEYFFTPLVTVVIVVAGGIWIARGALEIASLLVFIMYAAYLLGPIPKLAGLIPFFQSGFVGFVRFLEIMDTVPDISDAENAKELKVTDGGVAFENVTFRYNEGSEYVLHNINLKVKPGETVAIVGRSGIGKSTLCSLIPRLYEASGGAVRIDGVNVREVTQDSLRKQIGVVRQETFLFAGTVMENILYGKPGAADDEAIEAAKRANAHDFIMELPNGYATNIGQRGVKLSGGQQQRLSIARVFLKNPPILIFDEATSSLDMESEKAVMESLNTLAEGRTTFVIAHRLSTVRSADRIAVLTDGGITEQGNHAELIAQGGMYSKLCNTHVLDS
ncbi:MAG: ABC transporter ATP-binding protein/permease [Defluviitaleaceae bacterium]|nr:ABC transporter ATP-binding protein/permease [Defluviitaleaceae bacterium]